MVPVWIGCPATNFQVGRCGFRPEAIVMHRDGSFDASGYPFRDPSTQKSAHYLISLSGVIHQCVNENDTAFHAGIAINPTWSLLKPGVNPNFYTCGIEHEGATDAPWPDAQLAASAALIFDIAARWGISLDADHIVGHDQIRASKTCPGDGLHIVDLLTRMPNSPPLALVASSSVQTVNNVNLRQARPNTAASILSVIPANTNVAVAGFAVGERVQGNAYWYANEQGNYFWAGATNAPDPKPLA